MLSRCPVSTTSCPTPGILSHQPFSIMSGKLLASCANHIFFTILPMILNILTRDDQSNGDTQSGRLHIYILQLNIFLCFFLVDSGDEGRQMINPMQIHVAVEFTFIFIYIYLFIYSYAFCLYFTSLGELTRHKQ